MQTLVSVVRRAFVIWIALFGGFAGLNDAPFELGHLIAHSFQVGLHRQQDMVHLREIVLQMSHGHL